MEHLSLANWLFIMIMIIIDNDHNDNDNENDDDNDDNTFSSKLWCLLVSVSSNNRREIRGFQNADNVGKVGDYVCHIQLLWCNIYPIRRPVASSGDALRGQSGASLVSGESISLVCNPFVYCTTLDGLIAAVFADRTGFVERHLWTLIQTAITQCGSFCVILSD